MPLTWQRGGSHDAPACNDAICGTGRSSDGAGFARDCQRTASLWPESLRRVRRHRITARLGTLFSTYLAMTTKPKPIQASTASDNHGVLKLINRKIIGSE